MRGGINWFLVGDPTELNRLIWVRDVLAPLPTDARPAIVAVAGLVRDLSSPESMPEVVLMPNIVRGTCERSLSRLGIDRLDVLLLAVGSSWSDLMAEAWGEAGALINEGKVSHAGLIEPSAETLAHCEGIHHVDLVGLSWRPSFCTLLRQAGSFHAMNGTTVLCGIGGAMSCVDCAGLGRIPCMVDRAEAAPAGVAQLGPMETCSVLSIPGITAVACTLRAPWTTSHWMEAAGWHLASRHERASTTARSLRPSKRERLVAVR